MRIPYRSPYHEKLENHDVCKIENISLLFGHVTVSRRFENFFISPRRSIYNCPKMSAGVRKNLMSHQFSKNSRIEKIDFVIFNPFLQCKIYMERF